MSLVIYIICCNTERENFVKNQMIDLKITFPIVYYKAFIPENSQEWLIKDDNEINYNEKLQCCCRSHFEVIKEFQSRKEDFLLILEDDVCLLKENFESKLKDCIKIYKENYHNLDFLTLGYLPTTLSGDPFNLYFPFCTKKENIVYDFKKISNTIWGTQAQLFSREKIDKILKVIDKPNGKELLESVKNYISKNGYYQYKNIYVTPDSILPSLFSQGVVESHLAIEKNYGLSTSVHDSEMKERKNSWIIGEKAGMYIISDFYSY
jgi:GR25 family glycosyltransferase involved in LPS biosynthesis